MVITDDRIDAYIEAAAPFARPILKKLRKLIHQACPEVEEALKWSAPSFSYKGILCGMAAFQKHCVFGFWKGDLMADPHHVMDKARENAMGQFGRMTSLEDLPNDKIIVAYIKEAMRLNDEGIKLPRKAPGKRDELEFPEYVLSAIKKNKKAWTTFEGFPYSKKKDYVEWVTEAKQEATRQKRLAITVEWLSEGKSRNWKYE